MQSSLAIFCWKPMPLRPPVENSILSLSKEFSRLHWAEGLHIIFSHISFRNSNSHHTQILQLSQFYRDVLQNNALLSCLPGTEIQNIAVRDLGRTPKARSRQILAVVRSEHMQSIQACAWDRSGCRSGAMEGHSGLSGTLQFPERSRLTLPLTKVERAWSRLL